VLCVLVEIDVCEFVRRCGSAKRWAVDIEKGFWEVGIIKDEEDKNLHGEGGVARGESVASVTDALSNKDCEFELSKDCEFELSLDWAGDEADGDGKSEIVLAAISNGVGRSITMGSLGVGFQELGIVVFSHSR